MSPTTGVCYRPPSPLCIQTTLPWSSFPFCDGSDRRSACVGQYRRGARHRLGSCITFHRLPAAQNPTYVHDLALTIYFCAQGARSNGAGSFRRCCPRVWPQRPPLQAGQACQQAMGSSGGDERDSRGASRRHRWVLPDVPLACYCNNLLGVTFSSQTAVHSGMHGLASPPPSVTCTEPGG